MPMPVSSPMKMNTEMELGVRCERLELRVPVVHDDAELSDMTRRKMSKILFTKDVLL